jgi:hypothetical protein
MLRMSGAIHPFLVYALMVGRRTTLPLLFTGHLKVKEEQSLYRPGQTLRVPGG